MLKYKGIEDALYTRVCEVYNEEQDTLLLGPAHAAATRRAAGAETAGRRRDLLHLGITGDVS